MDAPSTTARGNEFRDRVAALLRAANLENVTTEVRLGAKTVDILFEEKLLTRRRRIAVECKDYDRPLTMYQISREISPDYTPLLSSGRIDGVLIVARTGINADARAFVEDSRGLEFKTYLELQNSVMDFGSYLQAMRAQFHEHGLDEYYVRPKLEGGADLEEHIRVWLNEPNRRPIAILAGYGMGKTSFARRAAALGALEHGTSCGAGRIPVFIRLGEISNEQGLEGLLGKVFTATNVVRNYNFDLFMELNRAGRITLLLDGFDEMKHTMSWPHFRYNFSELNRLVVPNSKVLLLGRPSAFLSDTEHDLALRGLGSYGGKQIREPGWPEYEEVRIAEFTPETAYAFMTSYATYTRAHSLAVGADATDARTLTQRLEEVRSVGFEALIGRPIQARMLAEIAFDTRIAIRAFSGFELYDIFISRILDREAAKPARRLIESEKRREFMRDVAWWLWSTGRRSGFSAEELPKTILDRFGRVEEHEIDPLKRELLAGSILERKSGDTFYFAHRSFQEFLVAEYMLAHRWGPADIHQASDAWSVEVDGFLRESGRGQQIADWFGVLSSSRPLKFLFLTMLAHFVQSANRLTVDPATIRHAYQMIVLVYARFVGQKDGASQALTYTLQMLPRLSSPEMKAAALAGSFAALPGGPGAEETLKQALCALVLAEASRGLAERLASLRPAQLVSWDQLNPFLEVVVRSFRWERDALGGTAAMTVDLEGLLVALKTAAHASVEGFGLNTMYRITLPTVIRELETLGVPEAARAVEALFARHGNPFDTLRAMMPHPPQGFVECDAD